MSVVLLGQDLPAKDELEGKSTSGLLGNPSVPFNGIFKGDIGPYKGCIGLLLLFL